MTEPGHATLVSFKAPGDPAEVAAALFVLAGLTVFGMAASLLRGPQPVSAADAVGEPL